MSEVLRWWPVLALAAGIGSIPLAVGWVLNRRMADPQWRARRRAALNQRLDALDVAANHVADQLLELEARDAEDAPPWLGCMLPVPGWWCSREKGHDGPCAARRGAPETNGVLP